MKYIIEIADRDAEKMADQIRYLQIGGDIWISAFADTEREVVPILDVEGPIEE